MKPRPRSRASMAEDAADAASPLCLFDRGMASRAWSGLVASKMKERLHRPVIAFAPAEPGSSSLRGSARSIPGFHIRDALANVDSRASRLDAASSAAMPWRRA